MSRIGPSGKRPAQVGSAPSASLTPHASHTHHAPTTGPTTRPGERPETTGEDAWIYDRWTAPLYDMAELRQQVRRGKILARKGNVRDLQIRAGLLSAEVISDSGESHAVKIRMDIIDQPTWVSVVEAISGEAALAADLIRGRLSERLAEIFEEAGHDLFPFDLRDVSSYCSCREDAKVCTGAVATHLHFAEVIQADPMKLLAFRGRDKAWLEDEVRERRGGAAVVSPNQAGKSGKPGKPVKNGKPGKGETKSDANESLVPASSLKDGFWERGAVPAIAFMLEHAHYEAEESFPVVRALGPGPGDLSPSELADALTPLLRISRHRIEHILDRAEHESEAPPPPVEAVPETEPLDELLIAAARRQGQLTTGMVAQALGVSAREAREYLQYLVTAGKLKVVGKARGTRYLPLEIDESTVSDSVLES